MKSSYLLLLSFVLLVQNPSLRSQDYIDSLKNQASNTAPGPVKFKIYGQISWYYISSLQLEVAHNFADSLRLNAEKIADSDGIAYAKFYYGVISRHKGNYAEALEHLNPFIEYYAAAGDSLKVSSGLFQIGSIYTSIGDYEKSLKALYRALRIHELEKNQSSMNHTLNGIAVVLKNSKRYEESLQIFRRILATDSMNTDVMVNMGNLYGAKREFKKAEDSYLKALKVDSANENKRFVASDLENLGNLYIGMKQYNKALNYGLQALKLRQVLPYKVEEAYSLRQVGFSYLKLKNYPLAKEYLLRAKQIAQQSKAKKFLKDVYKNLAELYAESNDPIQAYEAMELYSILKDSLLNVESSKQVNELKTRYETEKKDQQITLLAQEKELQEKETQRQATLKNTFILGGVLIALLGGLFFYTFLQRLKTQKVLAAKNEEIKEVNFRRQLTELEMKALQAQINPHFIFNCMSSINDLILEGDTKNASIYLTKFSKLMRLVLENSEETEISLKNELDLLKAYVQLEALRFNGNISCDFQVDNTIDLEDTYLPGMVLQPFIENAIWHGLQHKQSKNNGKITIEVEQHQDQLLCAVEDNGVGREKASELQQNSVWKRKSLGLSITEERLKLLNKELQKQLIHITDLKDKAGNALGTRVEVHIPFT